MTTLLAEKSLQTTYYNTHYNKIYIAAFLKLWPADHKWSSGSALVVLLD